MKVLVLAPQGRGDLQPFISLGRELLSRGHDVSMAVFRSWSNFVDCYGFQSSAIEDGQGLLRNKTKHNGAVKTPLQGSLIKRFAVQIYRKAMIRQQIPCVLEGICSTVDHNPDIVVYHPFLPGCGIAERLGVPGVPVCLVPCWVPTNSFANPWFPFLPNKFNRTSYLFSLPAVSTRSTRHWRRDALGLPGRRHHSNLLRNSDGTAATVLQPLSRHILPTELDYEPSIHTTGFWFLPSDTYPSPELVDYIAEGEPPICITFGSAIGPDSVRTARVISAAVRRAGVRAVVVGGSGAVASHYLGDNVLFINQAPFDWLFPRVSAVVHHGGIGTAASALAAGRPQLVCPFHLGHRFTGERLHITGVAPSPLHQTELTVHGLADLIRIAVFDRELADRAERIAPRVRDEGGAGNAVMVLESLV